YHASPYMEKFVLEALFQMGAADLALERVKIRHKEMVFSNSSTLWETWNPGFHESMNHGWSGGPLSLLMQYVVGVSIIEPEFKTFSVRPRLGIIKNIAAVVPTKFGLIDVKINQDTSFFRMSLNNPIGTHAEIRLPLDRYQN